MKYDDASWHYGGDFPGDLPPEAGGIHIAMFVIWCWLNDLAGDDILEQSEVVAAARQRTATPTAIFINASDEKFVDSGLNDEGNRFAQVYYGVGGEMREYIQDYSRIAAAGLPSSYHVPDSWETFDRLAPVIKSRFVKWRKSQGGWLKKIWPGRTS